ncbi:MAG: GNAT family N-acetyltransferase [Treponema sp.]|nr:GNAT family N-acetyltransferase [Treponema sp.]
MTFDLTNELTSEIAVALENQNEKFLVSAKDSALIHATHGKADEENYYTLPEWNSEDGFKIREEFVNNLHAPFARDSLQTALHSGRGVFKKFKDTLKNFPEVEKVWYQFRNRKMHETIVNWYNSLRDIWGLEKLNHFYEETSDLLHDDFTFQEYVSARDKDVIRDSATSLDFNCTFPYKIGNVFFELWRHFFEFGDSLNQTGFICRALTGDFAGCITSSSFLTCDENTAVLTSFFVLETFRGLGIGNELFSMCLSDLKKRGKQYVVTANIVIPDILIPLLERNGFEKAGSGFAAKLY